MKLRLGGKLLLALLSAGAAPLVVAAIASSILAGRALEDRAFDQLKAVSALKKGAIESYLQTIHGQVVSMAQNGMVVRAMDEFALAFETRLDEIQDQYAGQNQQQDLVQAYFANMFQLEYQSQNDGRSIELSAISDRMSDIATVMQAAYIAQNPHPLGSKHLLESTGDASGYDFTHATHHSRFRQFLTEFGYYDIFLVDARSGHIVYSVFKEIDYATSLLTGPYSDTGIAAAFNQALDLSPGESAFVDFAQYLPSYDAPASFIASPIFNEDERTGVLIFQAPLDRISKVMSERAGLGETGETYLVGDDNLMRSDSYLDPENRSVIASFRDPENGSVHTDAAKAALNGEVGAGIILDYRGAAVLSAYTPVDALGVRWALMAELDEAEAFAPVRELQIWLLGAALGILVIVVIAAIALARGIAGPIVAVTSVMARLADGDLTAKTEARSSQDEVGDMVRAIEVFREQAINTEALREQQAAADRLAKEERQRVLMEIADRFEGGAGQVVQAVTVAASDLEGTAQSMSDTAEQTNGEADVANDAAERASGSVQTVAAASEELGYSINEINVQMSKSTELIRSATGESKRAAERIKGLTDATEKIGTVVGLIQDIAERTKMLALNATIEAARAGESGKGFAVVAGEVKNLASQTADATNQISLHISEVEEESRTAVQTIEAIATMVERISESTTAVASAMEEQNAATQEISRSAQDGAQSAESVFGAMSQVKSAASQTGASANQMVTAASDLSRQARSLSNQVEEFLKEVRSSESDPSMGTAQTSAELAAAS